MAILNVAFSLVSVVVLFKIATLKMQDAVRLRGQRQILVTRWTVARKLDLPEECEWKWASVPSKKGVSQRPLKEDEQAVAGG